MEAKDTVKFKLEELNKLPHMGSLNKDVIEMLEAQAESSFKAGKKEGIWLYAWWKDGVQYVGTTGKTLAEALKEIDDGS